MSKFRELLEQRIQTEASECAKNHMENRNDSQHETGRSRGYWAALMDVLSWSTEIERNLNDTK